MLRFLKSIIYKRVWAFIGEIFINFNSTKKQQSNEKKLHECAKST